MHEDREVSRNMFSLHYCGNINLSKENGDIIKVTLRQDSISGCWKKKAIEQLTAVVGFHTSQSTPSMYYAGDTDPDSFVCFSPFYYTKLWWFFSALKENLCIKTHNQKCCLPWFSPVANSTVAANLEAQLSQMTRN